jgi:hypothetical protein
MDGACWVQIPVGFCDFLNDFVTLTKSVPIRCQIRVQAATLPISLEDGGRKVQNRFASFLETYTM